MEDLVALLEHQKSGWHTLTVEDTTNIVAVVLDLTQNEQHRAALLCDPPSGDPATATPLRAASLALLILRNVCSLSPDHQAIIADAFPALITGIRPGSPDSLLTSPDPGFLRVLIQMLCNVVAGNEATQAQLWTACFPHVLTSCFVQCASNPDAIALLLAWTHGLASNSAPRREALLSTEGKPLARQILGHLNSPDEKAFEWMMYLLQALVAHGGLEMLFRIAGDTETMDSGFVLQAAQLKLLQMATEFVHKERNRPLETGEAFLPINTCIFLIACVSRAATQLRSAPAEAEVLVEALMVLLELFGDLSESIHAAPRTRDALLTANLIPLCVQLLHEASRGGQSDQTTSGVRGIKVCLVRILGNLSYRHQLAQDQIRELHGLELILNQCRIDPSNEFVQEWSVLALRNLCEGNEENQAFINALKAQKVTEIPPEMSSAGITADVVDGKVAFSGPQTPK